MEETLSALTPTSSGSTLFETTRKLILGSENLSVNEESECLALALALLELDCERRPGNCLNALACGFVHYGQGNWADAWLLLCTGLERSRVNGTYDDLRCRGAVHFRLAHLEEMRGARAASVAHLKCAAKAGVAKAQLQLGEHLFHTATPSDDFEDLQHVPNAFSEEEHRSRRECAALGWVQRAAVEGSLPAAQYLLGKWYRSGAGPLVQDAREALHWLTLAARSGDGASWSMLKDMSVAGEGVAVDAELCRYLQVNAASYGDSSALLWLFQRCSSINCLCTHKISFLRAAARLGNNEASLRLAIHLLVTGGPEHITEALLWLKRASNLGDAQQAERLSRGKNPRLHLIREKARLFLGLALVTLRVSLLY